MRRALFLPILALSSAVPLTGCQDRQKEAPGADVAVHISVKADGRNCAVRERTMLCTEVFSYLRNDLKLPAGSEVHVNADPDAPYESVAKVLDELQRSEFLKEIAFFAPPSPDEKP